jgi:transposase
MAKPATPVERDERRRQVEHLVIAGLSMRAIARALGCNYKTVVSDVGFIRGEWREARISAYDKHASEELVRLAKLQESCWAAAMSVGSRDPETNKLRSLEERSFGLRAVGEARRVSDQRCRLLGLYAPLHVGVQEERMQPPSDFDREVHELLVRLDAADAVAAQAEADAPLPGDGDDQEKLNGGGP